MTAIDTIALTPDLTDRAGQYLRRAMRQHPEIDAVALCALNGKVIWASDQAFERLAPSIGRIGIASLRLWAKLRPGRVEHVGLMAGDGTVEIIFVPPLGSLLVVSAKATPTAWLEGEPHGLIAELGAGG